MISINKTEVLKPSILDYKNKTFLDNFNKIIENGNGENVGNLYKHNDVKEQLVNLYHYKCAYCEDKKTEGSYFEVEHFRPKNGIKGVNNHKGYYWLAYEWTNLLFSCSKCNRKKSNKFPLSEGNKKITDNLEKENFISQETINFEKFNIQYLNDIENPNLLNPEIDKVEEHFLFLSDGLIKPITKRAKATIDILELNRPSLIFARKKYIVEIYDELLDKFNVSENETELKNILNDRLRDIENLQQKHQKYSRLGYFVFFLFEKFIIERFKDEKLDKHAKILEKIYHNYLLEQTK